MIAIANDHQIFDSSSFRSTKSTPKMVFFISDSKRSNVLFSLSIEFLFVFEFVVFKSITCYKLKETVELSLKFSFFKTKKNSLLSRINADKKISLVI